MKIFFGTYMQGHITDLGVIVEISGVSVNQD